MSNPIDVYYCSSIREYSFFLLAPHKMKFH